MTEPALGLQARGRTLHRAQSATDEVGHLRKRKFRLTPQQGQYLVGSPLPRSYPRFYLRFYPRLRGNRFLPAVGDRLPHELDEAAAVARSLGSGQPGVIVLLAVPAPCFPLHPAPHGPP